MKIVVGLGNPGKKYSETRHNLGFKVVEELAKRFPIEKEESKYDAIIGHIRIGSEKVLLVKPLTYMNLSGKSVQPLVHFYKLELQDLIVIYDDMDLDLGRLRIRESGGTGGHKGMVSITQRLSTQEFPRIRVGIGRPEDETIDLVLGNFSNDE
ncbi:MAG: aminoacyl-tRNA hydrolase [Syntrophomonadaceae bacterium]|nr:aminoacyl-tRNA hydrolase [Syntrophomonadaceae bacterium]